MAVPLLVPLRRLDVEREQLQRRQIRVLHVVELLLPFLGEPPDHVPGEDEKAGPRDQRKQGVLVETGEHVQTDNRLEKKDQDDDEHARHHGQAAYTVRARENRRQVVEAQERQLLLDQVVDAEQGGD